MSVAVQKRNLRVLVCSGNLGNARPDFESLQAWIPYDGNYSEVVHRPQYPLPNGDEQRSLFRELSLPHFEVHEGHDYVHCPLPVEQNDGESENKEFFDLIAIGLQEATFDVEDDDPAVLVPVIQPILNKTVFKGISSGMSAMDSMMKSKDHTKSSSIDWLAKGDSKVLGELLRKHLPSYNFAVRYQRGEMRLEILSHVLLHVETLSVKAQNTGIGMNGVMNMANKGGITAELLVEGSTRMTFCTAHLQAHEGFEKYADRCKMAAHIFEGTSDTSVGIPFDLSLKSHFAFFLGDLNFRTELVGDYDKDDMMSRIRHMVDKEEWRELNKSDELFRALRNKDVFTGFQTVPCYFPPTFKVERNSGYVYKENRRPSYTDRILWRSLPQLERNIKVMAYEPIRDFVTSDHKPIRGAFELVLNDRIKPKPPLNQKRLNDDAKELFQHATATMGGRKTDSLHLFIREIKCGIRKRSFAPDPYVAFISFPNALVHIGETKWSKFKSRLNMNSNLRFESMEGPNGEKCRTVLGFPRTRKLKATYTPEWRDETHLVVKTHDKHGQPLNLTGAILMISVLDYTPSIESTVIGSFPFNLAEICIDKKLDGQIHLHDSFGREFGEQEDEKDHTPQKTRTVRMKQPLTRNGIQTGWISLVIDIQWMENKPDKLFDGRLPNPRQIREHLMQRHVARSVSPKRSPPPHLVPTTFTPPRVQYDRSPLHNNPHNNFDVNDEYSVASMPVAGLRGRRQTIDHLQNPDANNPMRDDRSEPGVCYGRRVRANSYDQSFSSMPATNGFDDRARPPSPHFDERPRSDDEHSFEARSLNGSSHKPTKSYDFSGLQNGQNTPRRTRKPPGMDGSTSSASAIPNQDPTDLSIKFDTLAPTLEYAVSDFSSSFDVSRRAVRGLSDSISEENPEEVSVSAERSNGTLSEHEYLESSGDEIDTEHACLIGDSKHKHRHKKSKKKKKKKKLKHLSKKQPLT